MDNNRYYNEDGYVIYLLSQSYGLGWASIFPPNSFENEILMFDKNIIEFYFNKSNFKEVIPYLESRNVLIVDENMMAYSWEGVQHRIGKPGETICVHSNDGFESIKTLKDFQFFPL